MDKRAGYRASIERILTEYAAIVARQSTPGVETLLAFAEERDQYLWLQVGWPERGRLHGTTVHIRLRDEKIWIEQDWTEDGVATDLLRAGVPRDDIVLAFHEPELRPTPEAVMA
jgi:hypothetical protein